MDRTAAVNVTVSNILQEGLTDWELRHRQSWKSKMPVQLHIYVNEVLFEQDIEFRFATSVKVMSLDPACSSILP